MVITTPRVNMGWRLFPAPYFEWKKAKGSESPQGWDTEVLKYTCGIGISEWKEHHRDSLFTFRIHQ